MQVVLQLLLRLGQCSPWNPTIEQEFEKTQFSLQEFYSKTLDDGTVWVSRFLSSKCHLSSMMRSTVFTYFLYAAGSICYGPFVKLPRDCQDVSVVSLYYFSSLNRHMLKSIASSCLCECFIENSFHFPKLICSEQGILCMCSLI